MDNLRHGITSIWYGTVQYCSFQRITYYAIPLSRALGVKINFHVGYVPPDITMHCDDSAVDHVTCPIENFTAVAKRHQAG